LIYQLIYQLDAQSQGQNENFRENTSGEEILAAVSAEGGGRSCGPPVADATLPDYGDVWRM
jgi:hypothetical protein